MSLDIKRRRDMFTHLDLRHETLIPLADVAHYLPKRHGRKIHYSTIYRWINKGTRGRILESTLVGGIRYTTVEAVQRFVGATSPLIITPSDELDVVNQALEEAGL
jgi:IS30 family transposase